MQRLVGTVAAQGMRGVACVPEGRRFGNGSGAGDEVWAGGSVINSRN
jgi:hypothetical protein